MALIKTLIITSLFLGIHLVAKSQKKTDSSNSYKPEIFTSGFIDIMNDGQVNASARFIRLFVGEPGKFAIPLSFYGGVSNNNFQHQNATGAVQKQRHSHKPVHQPLSGLINISVDGIVYIKPAAKTTKTGVIYQIGERVLTGYKSEFQLIPEPGSPVIS